MSSNSSASICEQSRSGKRYSLQSRMLTGVAKFPYCTGKEIARGIGLQYEDYCDSQKRLFDLLKLGKVQEGESRECSVTHRQAITYVPLGMSLTPKRLPAADAPEVAAVVSAPDAEVSVGFIGSLEDIYKDDD